MNMNSMPSHCTVINIKNKKPHEVLSIMSAKLVKNVFSTKWTKTYLHHRMIVKNESTGTGPN